MEDFSPQEPHAGLPDGDPIAESIALERDVSLGILFRLQTLGVEEAAEVAGALEALDPEDHLLKASLSNVATAFDEHRVKVEDSDERARLQKLSVLATAVHGMALLQAIRSTVSSKSPQGLEILDVAQGNLAIAAMKLEPSTYAALETIFKEVESTIDDTPEED